jgi:hypothetical protein
VEPDDLPDEAISSEMHQYNIRNDIQLKQQALLKWQLPY